MVGQLLNATRGAITEALEGKRNALQDEADRAALEGLDLTLPGRPLHPGNLHPLTQLGDRAIGILRRLGFALAEGPEIETEFHCFDALNTPPEHPARNEKDTFYFDSGKLLRTHTSTVQIRTMETQPPPIRVIAPGSCYRRDEVDKTHLPVFNQLEGLYVDTDVQVGDLKGALEFFYRALFGEETEVRFRSHFFPFTEPSVEYAFSCTICAQRGEVEGRRCRVCKGTGWIEIGGAGMVDPNVFRHVGYDDEKFSGFAFGFGIERVAMIRHGIDDIRLFLESDMRFTRQFSS